MDATQILRELASIDGLPAEAIGAARADRAALVPAFVRLIEQFVAGGELPEEADAVFVVFHLLGEWREKSAYRPLAALLRLPPDELDDILGEAVDTTSHRVMAAVFDGDPAPLYDIIRDPEADEAARSRMVEALAMVTLRGELAREETGRFLRACFTELPQRECFVWDGWQNAIAMLGLVELAPLVKRAFERGFIDPRVMEYEDFETELRRVLDGGPTPGWQDEREFELFGDTIEELAGWAYPDPDEEADESGERRARGARLRRAGAVERARGSRRQSLQGGRPQRPVSVRQRQEIQEVLPRQGRRAVAGGSAGAVRSRCGLGRRVLGCRRLRR